MDNSDFYATVANKACNPGDYVFDSDLSRSGENSNDVTLFFPQKDTDSESNGSSQVTESSGITSAIRNDRKQTKKGSQQLKYDR